MSDAAPVRWQSDLLPTIRLALPLIAGQLAVVGMNVVDTVYAGRIDAQTLAAVGLGTALWGPLLLLLVGHMIALSPTVAQLRGAGRLADTGAALAQGIALGQLVAVVAVAAMPLALPLMAWVGVEEALRAPAFDFLQGMAWGAPALGWFLALRNFCEGMGRTRPTMFISLFGLLALIPIAWILMFGKFGLPPLGAYGAGLANALAIWLQALVLSAFILRTPEFAALGALRSWPRPDWRRIGALAALGAPIAGVLLLEAGLFWAVLLLMGRLGTHWVAAHQVAINVAAVAFMVPLGLAMAVTVRVGYAAGRADPPAVRRAVQAGLALVLLTQSALGLGIWLWARTLADLYVPADPSLAASAAMLLGFAAVFQLPDGIQAVVGGALRGLKDTRVPLLLAAAAYWAFGFPIAYALGFGLGRGATGLWVGFILGLSGAALLLGWRLWRLLTARAVATPTSTRT